MALDAPNRRRTKPKRRPVAGPPTPKRFKPSVARGPQGLPGPRQAARTKSDVRARKRQNYGPQGLPGPSTPVVTQRAVEGRKEQIRHRVKAERKRLGVTTKIELGRDRSLPSLVHELNVARNATSRRHPVGPFGILGHRREFYDRSTGRKIPTGSPRNPGTLVMKMATGRVDALKADAAAPVLKVLDQTTRPLHGVAGGANAALKGHNVLKAVGRGLANKDKTTFSDVLKTAHAPKIVQSTLGYGLDVATDPTTYVSFGAGSVAKKAAVDAARKAEKKALSKGLTKEQAQRFGQRAAKRVVKEHQSDARGVTVKFGGREVPGVRRATAKTNRGVQRATPKKVKRAGLHSRHVAADFNPNIVPDGISREDYATVRRATRTARSTANRRAHVARVRARAIQKSIGQENYTRVLDAIEAGKIRDLPPELHAPARFLRDQFKYTRRVERRAGIAVGEVGGKRQAKGTGRPKGYVPHVSQERFDAMEAGTARRGAAGKTVKPNFAKKDLERKPLAAHRATDPGKYVEDPGVLFAGRMMEGGYASSRATLNRRLADMGRTVRKGKPLNLTADEAVYHVKGSDIRKLDPKKDAAELQRIVNEGGKNGRYVVLHEQAADRAFKTVNPSGERSSTGATIDRIQGVWKFIATQPNPGFHIRNAAGGIQNAYLGQPAHHLLPNLARAWHGLGRLNKQEKAYNIIGKAIDPDKRGIRIDGKKVGYDQLIKEAENVGALRSGFAARELTDLIENKGKVKTGSHFQAIKRLSNNIEDVTRLATYIEGRRSGLTAEQAAAKSARLHFDYSDLTELERKVLRRVLPFYTFSARNIPLQTMSLLQRPGKFAQYQKVREEFAKAFGIDLNQAENDSTTVKQRSAPIYVKINGRPVGISLGPSGLPLTDLSEFPTTSNPAKQADEWIDRAMSMVTPAIKTPVELGYNYSFFFRGQIERDTGPLVPAPGWVGKIPPHLRKQLKIVPDYVDKQTGKKGWGWPAKLAYATQVLPGPFNFANRVMTDSDRPGHSTGNKVLSYAGLKIDPVDPVTTRITNLYDTRAKVSKAIAALNQRGIYVDNATPEYRKLSDREKALTSQIMALRTRRGDVIHGGRPSASSFSPGIEKKLDALRAKNTSRFSPEIEKKLQALRK